MSNSNPGPGGSPQGGRPPAAQQARPVPPNPLEGILGNFSEPEKLGAALAKAEKVCNLVGPITVGALPVGCEVAVAAVRISGAEKSPDVYDVGMGRFALTRPAVDRIANAAGVDTIESTMLALTRDYCSFRVTRQIKGLDGTPTRQTATRVIDLRPSSAYRKSLQEKAKAKQKPIDSQVNEILNMLAAHTETKARLRADRALLGIRTYTAEELRLPFVVAKVIFTGKTDDPELRRLFAGGIMASMLSGNAALWGGQAQMLPQAPQFPQMGGYGGGGFGGQPPMLPQGAPSMGLLPPPGSEFGPGGGSGEIDDPDLMPPEPPTVPVEVQLSRLDWSACVSAGDFTVSIGKDKGTKISAIRNPSWLRGVLEGDVLNPDKARFAANAMKQLKSIYETARGHGEWTPLDGPPPGMTDPAAGSAPAGAGAPSNDFEAPGDHENDGR